MADLQLRLMGEDNASSAFNSVSGAARAAQQVIIDFTKQSIKAYAESERVQRQLQLVAKDLTGAMQAQATAMAQSMNISDELVQQMQTLLLRYGEAPGAVNATTQALIDYAAATGTDARAATELLTRGVESGTGHFKGLGIAITATGDRTKDLAAATAELAKKYGGAGQADAESLTGQVRGLEEAFGDLQEMFGGFIAEVASKTGVLDTLTSALRRVAEGAQIAQRFVSGGGLTALKNLVFNQQELFTGGANVDAVKMAAAQSIMPNLLSPATSRLETSALAARKGKGGRVSGGGGGGGVDLLNPNISKLDEGDFIDPTDAAQADFLKEILGSSSSVSGLYKRSEDLRQGELDMLKGLSDSVDKEVARIKQKEAEFAKVGTSLGQAFASSLSDEFEALASGGSVDLGQTVTDLIGSLLPVIGGLVGNLAAPGFGGGIGSALGGLFGAGVRGAGRAGITIQTFDGQSTREFFEGNGGRAFYNTLRTGRGALGNV